LLWPGGNVETSANNLYQALYAARKVLKSLQPFLNIRFVDDFLCLVADPPLWVDVEAFEAAAEQARKDHYPLMEEAHAGLMRSFALTGRRSQALHQYQFLKDLLHNKLGIEPDSEIQRIYQSILVGFYQLNTH
jgi:DNA-binding SARP family transcriptional activator